MAGLIGYEMKKLFSRRIVPFLLLALFVFNGLMVYRESGKSVGYGYTREDVGRVYGSLEGMMALEAEEFLSGRIRLLEAVDVWRQWADGQDTWNEEEKAGFLNSNRELMEAYPDLDIDAGYLLYLDNFRMEQWASGGRSGAGVGCGPLRGISGRDRGRGADYDLLLPVRKAGHLRLQKH